MKPSTFSKVDSEAPSSILEDLWGATHLTLLKKGITNEIYLAIDPYGNRMILRKMPNLERVWSLYKALCHYKLNGITTIEDCQRSGTSIWIKERFFEGVSLNEKKNLHLGESRKALMLSGVQIAMSLKHLYESEGILHLDIKPQNLLIDRFSQATLIDFGAGVHRVTQRNLLGKTQMGTPKYMSPERLLNPNQIGPQTDLYALSMTMAHWLSMLESPSYELWQWLSRQQSYMMGLGEVSSKLYEDWINGFCEFW